MKRQFKNEWLNEQIVRIHTGYDVCVYFIIGKERALLLDTGFGFGDLKGHIETLTSLPYDVVLTHGHCDHGGGSGQFDTVYLNECDWTLEKYHCSDAFRIDRAQRFENGPSIEEIVKNPKNRTFLPLINGQLFELGDLTIEMIAAPGHTKGSMMAYVHGANLLICGDASGEHALFIFEESATVEEHYEAILAFHKRNLPYMMVSRNHIAHDGTYDSNSNLIAQMIRLCEHVMNGTDDHLATVTYGIPCFKARDLTKYKRSSFESVGNIYYLEQKIKRQS